MLSEAERILVVSHYDPDGDALGSSLGLMHLLLPLGKQVFVHNAGPIPEEYAFLPGLDRMSHDLPAAGWPDLAVLLDCHQPERSGPAAADYLAGVKQLAVVDHHQGQAVVGSLRWVEPERAATAEMLALLAGQDGFTLNPMAATCLFAGIQTDTGSFRYSNTTPSTFRAAGKLVEAGADPWAVSQEVYATRPCRLRMLGRVSDHLSLLAEGRLAVSQISQEDFRRTGCGPEDLEQAVETLRSIRGVEVSLLLRELSHGGVKASMRSRGGYDVSAVALELGGGGHHNAAGVSLDDSLEGARERLSGMLLKQLEGAA
jgi:phosphoesterase RecJ-like protein